MITRIALPESCTQDALQSGERLCRAPGFLPQMQTRSSITLKANISDLFNFVDHPQLTLDITGSRVVSYHCDCPDYRANSRFCPHCAALAIWFDERMEAVRTVTRVAAVNPVRQEPDVPAAESDDQPSLWDFTYTFANSQQDLYPDEEHPRIPLKRFFEAYGFNQRALIMHEILSEWGGSCYGLAATSSMMQQGRKDTTPADFNDQSRLPLDLILSDYNSAIGMTLHTFIELVFVLQMAAPVARLTNQYRSDPLCMAKLAERVAAFQRGEAEPVIMLVYGSIGGHAVLPFRLEPVSPTEDRLHICDCNWPCQIRYATLEKDENGNYVNWRFPMFDEIVYSADTGASLSMSPYDAYTTAWDNRGSSAVDNVVSFSGDVAIHDDAGALLARAAGAGLVSYRENIFQLQPVGIPKSDKILVSAPQSAYTFRLETPRPEGLSLRMAGILLGAELTTDSREAQVLIDDEATTASVRIPQSNSRYEIQLGRTCGQEQEIICLRGITDTEPVQLMLKQGRLFACGLNKWCTLYINGKQQSLDCIAPLDAAIEERIPDEPELIANASPDKKSEETKD